MGPTWADFKKPEDAHQGPVCRLWNRRRSAQERPNDKAVAQIFDGRLYKIYKQVSDGNLLDYHFFVRGNYFSLAEAIEITRVAAVGNSAKVSAVLSQNGVDNNGYRPLDTTFLFVLIKTGKSWRLRDARCRGHSVIDERKLTMQEG